MILELKQNVYYETFNNKIELQKKIFSMILKAKADKILYKGDPNDIDYKLMKKVMLDDYTQKIEPELLRLQYKEIIESTDNKNFCIIYKEIKKDIV